MHQSNEFVMLSSGVGRAGMATNTFLKFQSKDTISELAISSFFHIRLSVKDLLDAR
jgi:hypothetical protein